MAIARLSVGTGKKGKASPHAQYIAREGKYAKDNNSLEKLEHTGHGNMPEWAQHDPNYLWKMADENERKNGSTYREHVIALPRELNQEQRHELVQDWIKQEIGDKHAYQYAIHNPPAMDGKEQPHCHLMFSERTRDGIERDPDQYFKRYNSKNPDKGGAKKANTGLSHADRRADLLAQRERWEQTCNKYLELAGSRQRISMKSLKAQGIKREPVNLTMNQLKKPEIKDAYKGALEGREDWRKAQMDVLRELNHTSLTELNIQKRLQKEQEQQKQKRTQKPIEPQKTPQATKAPLPIPKKEIEKAQQTEKPLLPTEPQPTPQEVAQARADIEGYKILLNRVEKDIREDHTKPLKETLDKMNNDYEKAKKPMFTSQRKWSQQQGEQRTEMQLLKRQISVLEFERDTEKAKKQLAKSFPKVEKSYRDAQDTIYESQSEHREQVRQQIAERQTERQAQRAVKGKDIGIDR